MPTVEMDLETTVEPARVRAALIDFSPRRPEIWPGITPGMYEVYSVGETTADIKESTKAPGMTVTPRDGGGSRVHIEWNRTPTTFSGRVAAFLITATKGRPVAASFKKAMDKLEHEPMEG